MGASACLPHLYPIQISILPSFYAFFLTSYTSWELGRIKFNSTQTNSFFINSYHFFTTHLPFKPQSNIPKMLQCLSFKSSSSTNSAAPPPPSDFHSRPPPYSPGNLNQHQVYSMHITCLFKCANQFFYTGTSTEATPRSSAQPSPTVNLTREYTLIVQTNSYNEMWSRIHPTTNEEQLLVQKYNGEIQHERSAGVILHPNRECVEETLRHAKPNTLTTLVRDYFNHSEDATNLCLQFHRSVLRARDMYAPLHDLLEILPLDSSLSKSQCDHIFNLLLEFDRLDNPFPSPDSHNFNQMSLCFSQLKQQLDRRLRKSRSRIRLISRATTGSALCFVCTAVGVAVSTVARALVARTLCTAYLPQKFNHKEVAHIEAAAMGTFKLDQELATIDRLVALLRDTVNNDKSLIRLGLDIGNERLAIQEVLKRLQKDHLNFLHLLKKLEEHICLCFISINRARGSISSIL